MSGDDKREIRAEENIHDFHVLLSIHESFLTDLLVFAWQQIETLVIRKHFSLTSFLFSKLRMFSFVWISRYTVIDFAQNYLQL